MLMFTMVVCTVALQGALVTEAWTIWSAAAVLVSLGVWFAYLPLYDNASPLIGTGDMLYGLSGKFFSSPTMWLSIIIIPIICVGRYYIST
jgi:phospholipid-transporting ATPase